MAKLIAYCGLDCGQCPAYIATQKDDQEGLKKTAKQWSKMFKIEIQPKDVICDGCKSPSDRKASYCSDCQIRVCCLGKKKENCAWCEEYVCQKLAKFFKEAPEAKKNLEKIKARAK